MIWRGISTELQSSREAIPTADWNSSSDYTSAATNSHHTVAPVLNLGRRNHEESERSPWTLLPRSRGSMQATTLQPSLPLQLWLTYLLGRHSNYLFGAFNGLHPSGQHVPEPAARRRCLDLGSGTACPWASCAQTLFGPWKWVSSFLELVERATGNDLWYRVPADSRHVLFYRQHFTEFFAVFDLHNHPKSGYTSNLNFPSEFRVVFICLLSSRIFHSSSLPFQNFAEEHLSRAVFRKICAVHKTVTKYSTVQYL